MDLFASYCYTKFWFPTETLSHMDIICIIGVGIMDDSLIKKQIINFEKARKNLLLLILCTSINLLLAIFRANFYLLFSATVPLFVFSIFQEIAENMQSSGILTTGTVVAAIIVFIYFLFWALSKRNRIFILFTLILFSFDCLLFVFLSLLDGFNISYVLDIVFHILILYYLIIGVVAWAKLRGIRPDYINSITQNNITANMEIQTGMMNQDNGINIEMDMKKSSPMRTDDKKGRILITSNFGEMQINMKRTRGLTELIVNGMVYDEIKCVLETDYSLYAYVNDVQITGKFDGKTSHMYLYADNVLLKKKLRLF